MTEEGIPVWVPIIREDVKNMEARTSESIKGVEERLTASIGEMVTRDALARVEEHWNDKHATLAAAIVRERDDRLADDEERQGRARRTWVGIWSVVGTFILAGSGIIATVIASHH